MYNDHKVIVCVPSGRYRYMRIILAYLLSPQFSSTIDEIRLWVNTDEATDLAYFERMEVQHPKVRRILAPGNLNKACYDAARNHFQYNDSIYRFYSDCIEPKTLYVKVDDDIVYIHPEFFNRLFRDVLARKAENYACVANVFNIPYVTKVLQDRGTIADAQGHSTGDPRCPFACTNGDFAVYIHRQFLTMIIDRKVDDLCFKSRALSGRQRVGVMAWRGESFASFNGQVGPRDEVELTTRIPQDLNKPLWMVGDAIACHFAFSHQRAVLEDKTNMLDKYLTLSLELNGDLAG